MSMGGGNCKNRFLLSNVAFQTIKQRIFIDTLILLMCFFSIKPH